MAELIPAALMSSLAALDASAMPSTAMIRFYPKELNPRGGSTTSKNPVDRHPEPIPCRVTATTPGTAAATGSRQGISLAPIGDATLAFPIGVIRALGIEIDADDEFEVKTVLPLASGSYTVVEKYTASGEPMVGSYATNVTVPVTKIEGKAE
jgi:hypothetical protein